MGCFMIYIKTKDFYEDISKNVEISFTNRKKPRKVNDLMKDKLGRGVEKIMKELSTYFTFLITLRYYFISL